MYYQSNNDCIACRRCAELCPMGAPTFDGDKFSIDPKKCVGCGTCARECPASAIHPAGYVPPRPPEKHAGFEKAACDLVVIGAGPAGLACAAWVKAHGKTVIVLDISKKTGGAGVHATGYTAFDTKWEKDAGTPEYMDDYVRAAMTLTRYQLDYRLISNAFRANTEFFDWFCEFGEAEKLFSLVDAPKGKSLRMDFRTPAGRYMCEKLAAQCERLGAEVRLEHRATQLISDGHSVSGVVAEGPAGTVVIACKACLIATGNMCCSPELGKYLPEYADAERIRTAHRLPGATGDGIRLAQAIGVPIDVENIASHYLGAMPLWFDGHVLKQGLRCEGIRVNKNGKRFVSESADRFDAVDVLLRQPGCVSFNVLDSSILEAPIQPTYKLAVSGAMALEDSLPTPGKFLPRINFLGMPVMLDAEGNPIPSPMEGMEESRGMGNYPPNSRPDINRLKEYTRLKGNHVCVADTLEELAEQMEVPAENLKETVARYNALCEQKTDCDFGKFSQHMLPVTKPPFIAIKAFLGTDGVFGGMPVDSECRVMGQTEPVKGLYAAGDITSGNYIKEHSHRTEVINDFTWANASGFLAGKTILKDFALN